jgi:hypothetical protein
MVSLSKEPKRPPYSLDWLWREVLFGLRWFVAWFPWFPILAVKELKPVAIGIGKVGNHWSNLVMQPKREKAVEQAEKNEHAKQYKSLVKSRTARAIVTGVIAVAGLVTLLVVVLSAHWTTTVAVLLMIAVVLDLIGRSGKPKTEKSNAALPKVLHESVPLSQVTKSILQTFEREGFPENSVAIAEPLRYDVARMEYSIGIKSEDEIKAEHLRAIERAIGAKDYAIRNLATNTASIRRLCIRIGDPLAVVEEPPFLPSRSRSITDYLDLGETTGDVPFALKLAGIHTAIVGKTGSGKTEGLMWTMIDRLSACRDAVIYGIDLQAGPAFPMWRNVIQKTAYNEEDAEALLAEVQEEIDRRMLVLQKLAMSDDDTADASKWNAEMGPALVIFIDEFAVFSAWNGSKNKPIDLMGALERVIRTGRKVWVTLVMATQKSGNNDFGSTVISSQTGIKILLACEESDTVRMLSVEKRDAGWSPHALTPATDEEANDAGKAFVFSPRHTTPDIYRSYMAMEPLEVKRRARQREADGLPQLGGGVSIRKPLPKPKVEVPEILSQVRAAFEVAGDPDWLTTVELLDRMNVAMTEAKLATKLRPYGVVPGKLPRNLDRSQPRGYALAEVVSALGSVSDETGGETT